MSESFLPEGTVFAKRYRIVRRIAAGGMGAVYEVVHLETDRKRALKVMLPSILHNAELRDRFKLEARVAANVDSEFIVDVFDAGHDEETQMPFLVMELLKGEELGARLERVGRFSSEETVTFLHQACLALDKTHRANIVHRDLKPENLFLTQREDGSARIKVLDFGIAKLVAEGNTQANATRSLGTPMYMSPEQFNTNTKVSPSTDIYAIGMMAYTFLVGRHYWHEESEKESNVFAFALTAMQGAQEPATVRAARAGVTLPPAFDEWFKRITHPEPSKRFQIASASVVDLCTVLGVPAPTGGRVSFPDQLTQSMGMRRGQAANASGISAPVITGTGGGPIGAGTGTGVTAAIVTPPPRSGARAVVGAVAALTVAVAAAGVWMLVRSPAGGPATAGAETAAPLTAPEPQAAQAATDPVATAPVVEPAPSATATAEAAASASATAAIEPKVAGAPPKAPVPGQPKPPPGKAPAPTVKPAAAQPGTSGMYGRD